MDSFQKKIITTSRFAFSYYVSESRPHRPTLLLQHGFPDDARLWNGIASKLGQYRLIVPDLLGYSGTSKPTDPAAYSFRGLAQDLIEILDAEGIKKVISVGHDWGSMVAQRLYAYHPDRVEGLVLLNLGYMLPSAVPFDLQSANALFEKNFGYPIFAYWEFFTSDEAPALLRANAGRLYDGLHGAPRDWMKELFCVRGNMRKWLLSENWNVEVRPYAQDPNLRQAFVERFQRDGFEGPLCYYLAMVNNVQYEAEKGIPKDDLVVRVPTLYIICTQDSVCRPEASAPAKHGGFLPDIEEVTIDCAHWSPLERPDEIAEAIKSFLERRFAL
ncbi:hypothetical protein DL764_004038 [Monosporascus ibericus]|uniref:AB hydrolase-1 domain-containing protein n=1 Tax=Monosporascus ibericus TaxID=155417 RepID=A0A4Q4THS3_9PEZI|nr:hypothetical protein DL764_004038 [Monosporascus ibericus]